MRNRIPMPRGISVALSMLTLAAVSHAHAAGTAPDATAAEQAALDVGDKAIDGTLTAADGSKVELSELWAKNPLVVIWYRGGWCPICSRHLKSIQQALPEFQAAGATLVAIAPELPEKSAQTVDTLDLGYTVLSDPHNELGKKYGVVFKLDDDTAAKYQQYFHLTEVNGDDSFELPIPAAYAIGTDGVIDFAYLVGDYHQRVKPDDILKSLKKSDE
jgi:peroxiredoxin